MKLRVFFLTALLLAAMASPAPAEPATSVNADIARGDSDSMAYSLSIAQKYAPWFSNGIFEFGPTAEIGGHAWVDDKSHVDTVWGGHISPGVYLTLFTDAAVRPFVAVKVGGALNSQDHMDDRDFGSHLLFRTRGSVGVSFGDEYRHTVQGSYTHYSTWGITKRNDGYGAYGISYGYSF
jgi:hypothetical protein